ncbi:hypothetical protein ACSAZL_10250 [Methanosarcina sp. T3]|uniref:hypothetical protein n=1 Tax=Methanosarcina sp. T3 TaxID=3439062 RepID=UPI003F83BDF0
MAYETVLRTEYPNPESSQVYTHNAKDHYIDFQNFVSPMERMHNSNLHDWGVARGLEVRGSIGETQVVINPGVAIDISGQLVSLSSSGHGANDPENPTDPIKAVPVPVSLNTESYAGKTAYVTIQFSEICQAGFRNLSRMEQVQNTINNSDMSAETGYPNLSLNPSRMEQVPWVRLQCVDDYEEDPVAAVRYQAALSDASGNKATVTPADYAAKFKPGDIISLVQDSMRERAVISSISEKEITFTKNLTNEYTGGTIRIADLIPQQRDIRLANTTSIEPGTYINIIQNNIAELRIVQSVDHENNFITLIQGLVNTYAMENTDVPVNIEIVEKSIVLAIAVIDNEGKLAELAGNPADLKTGAKLPKYHRRLIGESVEELRIQRSVSVGGTVQDILSGKAGPSERGGLKITVPDAQDSILFAREDGGDFKSLGINANVGIGTADPRRDLDVSAKSIKLGLEKNGGGQLILKNNPNDNMIYLEAFGSNGKGSASALVLSGDNSNNVPVLNLNAESTLINGKVIIGTTNSSASLEVNGDIKVKANLVIDGNIGIGGADPVGILSIPNFRMDKSEASPNAGYIRFGDGTGWKFHIGRSREKAGGDFNTGTTGVLMTVQDSGKVGIGTTDPKDTLDVCGNAYFGTGEDSQNHKVVIRGPNSPPFTSFQDLSYEFSGAGSAKVRAFRGGSWDTYLQFLTNPSTAEEDAPQVRMHINDNGNVGIGTTDPKDTLDVYGQIRLFGQNAFRGSDPFLRINPDNNFPSGTHFAYRANFYGGITTGEWWDEEPGVGNLLVEGNIGIGTTNPSARLDIQGDIRINDKDIWMRGGTDCYHGIGWYGGSKLFAENKSIDGPVVFGYNGGALGTTIDKQKIALQWNSEGNVGIGTANPSVKLEVNGDIKATNKKFSINHPLYPDTHNLVHSTLEGPETAVFYRGEAQLSDGEKTILLPDYFEALTRKENRTVLLTPKFEEDFEISMLAASEVKNGKFTVKMIDNNNSSQKFYWEVKAIRSDVEILEVEPAKIQVNSNV